MKRRDPSLPVLMISGHGNLDTVAAIPARAQPTFLEKPFEAGHLVHLVARATETDRLRRENASLKAQIGQETELTGSSVSINAVRATLKRVAATGSRVLISGPAGVGKEVAGTPCSMASRKGDTLRLRQRRADDPGAGRGGIVRRGGGGRARPAGAARAGSWRRLFLDEISHMPIPAQAKILRVLTDQSFARVGGQRVVKVEMRVVPSTSRHLADEIAGGRFRDYFYRLNVVPVHLPALAERPRTFRP